MKSYPKRNLMGVGINVIYEAKLLIKLSAINNLLLLLALRGTF
jgi:hypothetical protein